MTGSKRTNRPRFRTTPWPTAPLEAVEVERAAAELVDGWLIYGKPQLAQLGHEIVIRDLLKLELVDDAEVAAFIEQHGMLSKVPIELAGFEPERPGRPPRGHAFAHVNDARVYLLVTRCLARHWLADRLDEDVVSAWHELHPGFSDEQTAWASFASCLSHGLEPFHARVTFTALYSGGTAEIGRPQVGLYSGLCHQLFNLFVDESPVTRCANEPCGRAFVRQAGRAEHGQYRTEGVLYCSKACARAQAERQRRRRMKGDAK